jgi:coenzyme Q-binding protein COQ10
MPQLEYKRILPFTDKYLFDLVLDIESYPEFLEECSSAKIISQDNEKIIADLAISFKGFEEKYRSEVTIGHDIIEARATSGPFQYLYNKWKFNKISETETEIEFFIDFEFNNSLLSGIMNLIFQDRSSKMLLAFEKRANSKLI